MSIEIDVQNETQCDECGDAITLGEDCYCGDCLARLESRIDELEAEVEELKEKIAELEPEQ